MDDQRRDDQVTDERFEALKHVNCAQTDKQLARARSVEHSRGPSGWTTSDIAKFAGPLLRVRNPHTPLIREAPGNAGRKG